MNLKWKKAETKIFKLNLYSTGRQLFCRGNFFSRARKSLCPVGRFREREKKNMVEFIFWHQEAVELRLKGFRGNCSFLYFISLIDSTPHISNFSFFKITSFSYLINYFLEFFFLTYILFIISFLYIYFFVLLSFSFICQGIVRLQVAF